MGLIKGIAALCAMAVAVGGTAVYRKENARVPLVIEVIAPQSETVPAAAQESPSVLIYHSHTWEAYAMTQDASYVPTETWRTKDDEHNMTRVGEELAKLLRERGFAVVHDKTDFEPPSLSGAYTRSLDMLRARFDAGETYDYVFDVHRDAFSGNWNGDNAVSASDGTRMAYVMFLVGKGTGTTGAGFDERPDWPQNLALAEELTDALNAQQAGVCREVKVKTGRFNQHVSTGALLIEVGNNQNTLEEALAACPAIADAIAQVHADRHAEP